MQPWPTARLPRKQADRILEHAGQLGRGRHGDKGRGDHGPGAEIFADIDMKAIVAEALGITPEELAAYHEDGLRLPEIAAELGVDETAVHEAVQTAKTDAVNQAVADGIITQEQADRLLEGGRCDGKGRRGGPRGGADHDNAPTFDNQDA